MNKKHGARVILKDKEDTVLTKIVQITLSLVIEMVVFFVLILAFALYSASQDDPRKYMSVFGIAAAAISSLLGGFTASRFFSGGIGMGTTVGVVYVLMLLILRLIFAASEPFGVLSILVFYPGLIGASFVGSLVGRYRPDPARSRKKRIKNFTD